MKMVVIIALLMIPLAFGHGYGNAQSVQSGDALVEFGITDAEPRAGDFVGLSFSVDRNGVPITSDASLRILKDNRIYLSSSGLRLTNSTLLTVDYLFPESGTYDVELSAGEHNASFKVEVDERPGTVILGIAAGVLVAAAIALLMRRYWL